MEDLYRALNSGFKWFKVGNLLELGKLYNIMVQYWGHNVVRVMKRVLINYCLMGKLFACINILLK